MNPACPMENWPVRPFTKFSDTARMTAIPMWLMFWNAYSSRSAESLEARHQSHQGMDARVLRRVEHAGDCRQYRPQPEGEADDQVDVHAHQRGHRRVPGDRAHGGADAGVEHDPLQDDHQHHAGGDGDEIDVADGDAGD